MEKDAINCDGKRRQFLKNLATQVSETSWLLENFMVTSWLLENTRN